MQASSRHASSSRQALGDNFDPRDFETQENKLKVLDQLVDRKVLQLAAKRAGIQVSDAAVRKTIAEEPAFQVDGKFDAARYTQMLATQTPALSPVQFQKDQRDRLQLALIPQGIADSGFATSKEVDRLVRLLGETRDITIVALPPTAGRRHSGDRRAGQGLVRRPRGRFQTGRVGHAGIRGRRWRDPGEYRCASRRGRTAQTLRRRKIAFHEPGTAPGFAHPGRSAGRCRYGGAEGSRTEGGHAGGAGQAAGRGFRRVGQGQFRRRRLQGGWRRPVLGGARRKHGEAVRGCVVLHAGWRNQRAGEDRLRLSRPAVARDQAGPWQALRGSARRARPRAGRSRWRACLQRPRRPPGQRSIEESDRARPRGEGGRPAGAADRAVLARHRVGHRRQSGGAARGVLRCAGAGRHGQRSDRDRTQAQRGDPRAAAHPGAGATAGAGARCGDRRDPRRPQCQGRRGGGGCDPGPHRQGRDPEGHRHRRQVAVRRAAWACRAAHRCRRRKSTRPFSPHRSPPPARYRPARPRWKPGLTRFSW